MPTRTQDSIGVLLFNLDPAHRRVAGQLQACLEGEGYDVHTGESEADARAILSINSPRVLILSAYAGGAIERLRLLRDEDEYDGIIIVIAGDPDLAQCRGLERKLEGAGANDVFLIPFDPQLLVCGLARTLEEG